MTEIDAKMVSQLRKQTGAPMMDCKAALVETGGNMEEAVDVLRKKGLKSADSKGGREVTEGKIFSYVHPPGKIGVLLEIACETDFVARNEEFNKMGNDLCLHIAAMKPMYMRQEDIPAGVLEKEREILTARAEETMKGKPAEVMKKVIEGQIASFINEQCLLTQHFFLEEGVTIDEHVKRLVAKTGENMKLRRFVRLELGG